VIGTDGADQQLARLQAFRFGEKMPRFLFLGE
jgi:hypothetical protein